MSVGTAVGYYESHPVIAGIVLRTAARRANLSAGDRKDLAAILSSGKGLVVSGQVLDDTGATVSVPFQTSDGGSTAPLTAKLGDGTLLKLLIDNLPAIIQAIMQIMSLFPKPATAEMPTAMHGQMPTDFAIPPMAIDLAEEVGLFVLKAAMPRIEAKLTELEAKIDAWLTKKAA